MPSAILEYETRTGDEILHGRGDKYLGGVCERFDSCSDVDGETPHVVAGSLDLSRVQSRSDLDGKRPNSIDDRLSAPDGSSRTVECGQEAVAGCIHFDTTVEY